MPRKQSKIVQFLTQAELKRLLAVVKDKRDRAIIKTAYRHGLRASEVGMLQKDDADLKQGRITIRRLKGSLGGVYPMSADTVKVIRAYLRTRDDHDSPYLFISNRGLPIDRRTLWKMMQTYARAAGLPEDKQQFHILKHSIATHLLDAGADLSFV
jgi:site-specific recombinase XerD